jgi:CheY-like chemotaxis protein
MPEMDGFELAWRVRNSPQLASTAVIMLTSSEQREDVIRCRDLQIAEHLTKPVHRGDLLAAIARVLSGRTNLEPKNRGRSLAPGSPPPASRLPLHILLAEDNPVNQRMALRMLEKAGHRVVVADNGLEALKALDEQSFDMVLMDVQMPYMDGFEAAAAIREKERGGSTHIPIIAMTAHAMAGDRERCLARGMDDYISKPVQVLDLLEMISEYSPQFTPAAASPESVLS